MIDLPQMNITGLVFLMLMACGKSDTVETDPIVEVIPDPVQVEDVFADGYWDKAELVWSDEFDGDGLSADNWVFETGDHGWGNNELQNYVANDNVEVINGILKIMAKKEQSGSARYTSTRLNSKETFRYGRMEIRAKIPEHKGNGL